MTGDTILIAASIAAAGAFIGLGLLSASRALRHLGFELLSLRCDLCRIASDSVRAPEIESLTGALHALRKRLPRPKAGPGQERGSWMGA